MTCLEEIRDKDGNVLAIVIRNDFRAQGINFFSRVSDPLQIGINAYVKNDRIKAHRHVNRQITIEASQELVYIKSGEAKLDLYDSGNLHVKSTVLMAGDLAFFVSGGHGLDIIENTTIVEVKQGPYFGKSVDKVMIE